MEGDNWAFIWGKKKPQALEMCLFPLKEEDDWIPLKMCE